MEILGGYRGSTFDEMLTGDGLIREHWKELTDNLDALKIEGLKQKQEEIDWELKENGVSYNIYNDSESNRKWSLDPIPFILTQEEWSELAEGLIQRVKLFESIFKDIYGEQQLLKKGILPPEILYLDTHFIREVHGYAENYYEINLYGADLSRGPDGKFWIISDKTEAPSGLGYTIENRLTIQSINHELMENIDIHPVAKFVEGFKKSLSRSTSDTTPFVVMLSPGPYNETYFEHAYLSTILDCQLARGEDLLVKDTHLYLKTISGLKKVDIIIRRVDDRFCDPLELNNDSQLGVAGLLEVLRLGNVKMINPIGIGILENLGLNPFLNSICEYFFGEPLKLPQIATWWCGQENEREYVLKHLHELIIKSIDKRDPNSMFIGEELDEKSILDLKEKILASPYSYIAQEHIEFSSVPSYTQEEIRAKKNTIRLFCYKESQTCHVMKGGLARISSNEESFIVSNQQGGGSKDLWVLSDKKEEQHDCYEFINPFHESTFASIATKRAENIYWLGRYLKRSILTARFIRINIKYLLNGNIKAETMDLMLKALTHLTMTYPGFFSEKPISPNKELIGLIHDRSRSGTLSFTISLLGNIHLNIRDQLSNEARKVFDNLEHLWYKSKKNSSSKLLDHIDRLDEVLIYLSAYKELIRESISKEEGIIFYQIGSKVEMGTLLVSKIRSLLTFAHEKKREQVILQFLLTVHEGYSAYRSYHKSNLRRELVVEFLLCQKNYARSLYSIVQSLLRLTGKLREMDQMELRYFSSLKYLEELSERLQETHLKELMQPSEGVFFYDEFDAFLNEVSTLLNEFSLEFTKNYFSHYYE